MSRLRLTEIWIYPVKSLGGIRLKSSSVMKKGLKYDRRWMLVDGSGTFMTQRVSSKMALVKLSMDRNQMTFHFDADTFSFSLNQPVNPEPIHAKVWEDEVITYEASQDLSEWISTRLGIACRLVAFPEINSRPVDPVYKVGDDHVSLADGFPFLIIGEESLNFLNSKLEEPVPMNRFRPNLVFSGGEPHEEDTWTFFKIGKNRFKGVKPCSRCVVITIDQKTGAKGKEPLAQLATYRKLNGEVYFGQNVIAIDYETIEEGDEIEL